MASEPAPDATLDDCLSGILAAGHLLQNALDTEEALSRRLKADPGDPNLHLQLQMVRHQTQTAFEDYSQSVRQCAHAAAENKWSTPPRPKLGARLLAAVTHPFRAKRAHFDSA